jgi:hypothetical protein
MVIIWLLISILLEEVFGRRGADLFLTVVFNHGSVISLHFDEISLFLGDKLDLHYKSLSYYIGKLIASYINLT